MDQKNLENRLKKLNCYKEAYKALNLFLNTCIADLEPHEISSFFMHTLFDEESEYAEELKELGITTDEEREKFFNICVTATEIFVYDFVEKYQIIKGCLDKDINESNKKHILEIIDDTKELKVKLKKFSKAVEESLVEDTEFDEETDFE
jgi:hypothetical protein